MNKRRRKKAVKKYLAGQPLRGHERQAAEQELRRQWRETFQLIRRFVEELPQAMERFARETAEALHGLLRAAGDRET